MAHSHLSFEMVLWMERRCCRLTVGDDLHKRVDIIGCASDFSTWQTILIPFCF
jgi:hypothetical protein